MSLIKPSGLGGSLDAFNQAGWSFRGLGWRINASHQESWISRGGFFFISLDFSYWELLSTLVESQCLSLKSWSRNTSNKATERTQVPSKRTIKVQALKLSVSEKICKLHFWCTLPKLGLCLMDMVIRCLYTFIFFFCQTIFNCLWHSHQTIFIILSNLRTQSHHKPPEQYNSIILHIGHPISLKISTHRLLSSHFKLTSSSLYG